MVKTLKRFFNDTDGAVTVDWVVLTALCVGLAFASLAGIGQETAQLGADLGATIAAEDISSTVPEGTAATPSQ